MVPSELLTNIAEEQKLDPTLVITIARRKRHHDFVVSFTSSEREEYACGRRIKSALAKALLKWNGDDEL